MPTANDDTRQTYIGTEHLLLGIVSEGNGRAMDALRTMVFLATRCAMPLKELIESGTPGGSGPAVQDVRMDSSILAYPVSQRSNANNDGSMLEQFGRNLTKLASDGKLDPVIGGIAKLSVSCRCLRRQKNNPLILGDPGVGKTAIVEGLAQLIASEMCLIFYVGNRFDA